MDEQTPTATCPRCEGSGKEFDTAGDGSGGHYDDCRACKGTGSVPDHSTKAAEAAKAAAAPPPGAPSAPPRPGW